MRIAFVNFYSGIAQRGGETYTDSLARHLSSKHKVIVFQAGPVNGEKNYPVEQIKVSYRPNHHHSQLPVTHPLKRLFLDYFHLRECVFTIKLLPKLWKIKPDVILPLNSGWEALLLRMFSTIINAKIIISGQSGPGWNDRVNLYIHPDVFVALTKAQAVWAKKATPWKNQKIVIIPNGVDTLVFSPKGEKREVNLPKPIVLVVGAAIKSKNIQSTIKAVAKLGKTSLLVLGVGPMEKEEDSLGKKLLGSRYKRLKVAHKNMPAVYRSSDIFTLCSNSSEAFGIAYLEAIASGLPCVATDDASRREILDNVGIYVKDPKNSQEYAKKLQEALKQKSPEIYINRARKCSWNKIADLYEKILDKE